jgi:hypothetical protein
MRHYSKAIFYSLDGKYNIVLSNPMFGENVRNAREGEFPFVVSIRPMNLRNDFREIEHICTGVLVSNRDVLSVDHCNKYFRNIVAEVIVGSNDICLGRKYYVSWWLSFNQWSEIRNLELRYSKNDITMLRVSSLLIEYI